MTRTRVIMRQLAKSPGMTVRELAQQCKFSENDVRLSVAQVVRDRKAEGEYTGTHSTKMYSLTALGRVALERALYVKHPRDVFTADRRPDDGQPIVGVEVAQRVGNSVFSLGGAA